MSHFDQLQKQLDQIKATHGEEAWKSATKDVAKSLIAQGGDAEKFARKAFAEVIEEPGPETVGPVGGVGNDAMMDALKMGLPHMKSQAQFNAFMAAFDALKFTVDAIFAGDPAAVMRGRGTLEKALEVAGQVTEVTNKLSDVPEAASSKSAEEFKQTEFNTVEYDAQKQLLGELEGLDTLVALNEWYTASAEIRNKVTSTTLRNVLFDAIRAKKAKLS